jgi:DnaJ-class molecular chaperone
VPAAAGAATPADPASPPASRSWIAATILALVAAAAGGAFFVMKTRRASGICRSCGVKLAEQGDLCQKCRHEAAEAHRRATAERIEEERTREEELRRRKEREEEEKQQRAADEAARQRQLEEAEQQRQRHQEQEAALRREEEARHRRESGVDVSDAEFDPYAVLAISPDAAAPDVDAAYAAARKKYDPDLVADMGAELQEHFRRKGEAVERAYQLLVQGRSE